MARRVLVVAAHPDDEVLGAGGAMCRHRSQTDEVFVALLGEGVTSRFATREEGLSSGAEDLKRLKQEIEAAHAVLAISTNTLGVNTTAGAASLHSVEEATSKARIRRVVSCGAGRQAVSTARKVMP